MTEQITEHTNAEKLLFKLQEVARNTLGKSADGVCFTTISLYLDRRGQPLLWYVEKACRLEPSSDAKDILRRILTSDHDSLDTP